MVQFVVLYKMRYFPKASGFVLRSLKFNLNLDQQASVKCATVYAVCPLNDITYHHFTSFIHRICRQKSEECFSLSELETIKRKTILSASNVTVRDWDSLKKC